MSNRYLRRGFALAIACCVLLSATPCHAEVFADVITKFQVATASWQSAFYTRATWLFWTLATIELSYIGITLAMKQADIQEIVGDLVRFVLITGFFFALMINGTIWIPAIVQSFREAGNAASVAGGAEANLNPSTIVDISLKCAAKLCESGTWTNPSTKVVAGLMGIGVLVAGALIAATMVSAIVEMYIVTTSGLLLLGFGSSRWTREYATKIVAYSVSVGVKLMVMQLLIGLGEIFLTQFAVAYNALTTEFSMGDSMPVGVSLIILLGLVRSIPNIAQSMVSGHSHQGQSAFGAAMQLGSQAMAAAQVATSVAMGGTGAVLAAAKLTSAQTASASSNSPPSSPMGLGGATLGAISKAATYAGKMAGNMAGAASADIKAGMTGQRDLRANMGQRMAASMNDKANSTPPPLPPSPPPLPPPAKS